MKIGIILACYNSIMGNAYDVLRARRGDKDLRRVDLSGEVISGADLSYADLRGANLSEAYLNYADLSFANLSDANLSNADLSDANLEGTILIGAYIQNTDFSDAIGISMDSIFDKKESSGLLVGA